MSHQPTYDILVFDGDDAGWMRLPGVLSPEAAQQLGRTCLDTLAGLGDHEVEIGDKAHAGTRRLVHLDQRLPEVSQVLDHPEVVAVVERILGPDPSLGEATFRCPFPGFGQQKLHADDLPLTDVNQTRGLTAVVPLVDFTADNGATRLIPGSHRRPDLQRRSGNLDGHEDEMVLSGRAGDMFLFSRHILHSGTKNRSDRPRPALQICWTGTGAPTP